MIMLKRVCRTCGCGKKLYIKFGHYLIPTKSYYCTEREEIICLDDFCENWQKKTNEKDLSVTRFDYVIEDVRRLKELLKDFNI